MIEYSDNYYSFLKANNDLPRMESNIHITINELEDGTLEAGIFVDRDTKVSDLRKVESLLLAWRDRIIQWQGPNPNSMEIVFHQSLERLKEQGYSYKEIADIIIEILSDFLSFYLEYVTVAYEETKNIVTKAEYEAWAYDYVYNQDEQKRSARSLQRGGAKQVINYLKLLRINDEDIRAIIKEGLIELKEGNKPSLLEYYITRDRIIYIMKEWKKSTLRATLVTPKSADPKYQTDFSGHDWIYKIVSISYKDNSKSRRWDRESLWDPAAS